MSNITFTDKNKNGSGAVTQWRDVDANEVKAAVNSKADSSALTTEATTRAAADTAMGVLITALQNKVVTSIAFTGTTTKTLTLTFSDATTLTATFTDLNDGTGSVTWGGISGTLSSQTDLNTALGNKQTLNANLTAIAALSPSNDDILQRKSGAWVNRTIAQVKTDLGLAGTNTGDETAAGIKTKLETLSGSNRLDASAIKNLPSNSSTYNPPVPLIRSQQTSGLLPEITMTSQPVVATSSAYNAFPTNLIDKLGRIQVFYPSGSSHTSFDKVLKQAITSNAGASFRTVTISTPQANCQEVHSLPMSNGDIGLIFSSCDGSGGNTRVYFKSSSDIGESFGADILVANTLTAGGPWITDLFEENGILYAAGYGYLGSDTRTSTFIYKSSDYGATWSSSITVASAPSTTDFNEATFYKWRNQLVLLIRDDTNNKLWRTYSTNSGVTWSSFVDVTPAGYVSSLPDVVCVGDMVHLVYRSSLAMSRATSWDGGQTFGASEVVETGSAGNGYEYSNTVYENGLLVTAYAMDVTALSAAEIKLRTYRYGPAWGLDGALHYTATSSGSAFPTSGLIGYWDFEEASGNFLDGSGNGQDLTPTGSIIRHGGLIGNAVNFNGSGQYLSKTSSTLSRGSGGFTVGGWFKFASSGIQNFIQKPGNGSTTYEYSIFYNPGTGSIGADLNDNTGGFYSPRASFSYVSGYHFVVLWSDGATIKIYVDDVEAASTTITTPLVAGTSSTFYVGNSSQGIIGDADILWMFDRPLTVPEMSGIYNGGVGIIK